MIPFPRVADRMGFAAASLFAALVVSACGSSPSGDDSDGGPDMVDAAAPADADPSLMTDDDGDGFSEVEGDCDDTDSAVHPGAEEVCDDGVDNNCNGATDDAEPDGDGDGFGPCNGDCDDEDDTIGPGADEVPGDGIDNDCDGIIDADFDGDGFTEAGGDCDDGDAAIHPDAAENCFDGVDNNCNGFIDDAEPDGDGDGFGPCQGDCDDEDPNRAPDLPEIDGDGIDNNCDFLVDQDIDGDGWTQAAGDCNDMDPDVNPSILEVCGDGIDNDCDGEIDSDCLTECELAAITRSSVGCVYYPVDTNPMHQTIPGDYAVAVSNIDPAQTANVVIEQKSGGVWSSVASFSVGPLSLYTQVLPHRFISGTTIYQGGAYRLTSDLPVVAYQFNPLDGSSSFLSDASLLLPVSAFDRFYIVPAWQYGPADQSNTSGWPAHVQIAATSATEVRVISPVASTAGNGVPTLQPNVLTSYDLEEGDFLQLTVQNFNESFNGMYIESDDPVAVYTSNDCANVPASGSFCCCEHLEEQVFGLQTWGTTYVAARVPQRGSEGAVWHIMAQQDATTVSFDANGAVTGLPGAPITLDAREFTEITVGGPGANPGDFLVTADKPILVTQYMVGAFVVQFNGSDGDPSMVQAVPVEQYLDQYVVLVPSTWINDYLVLIRTAGETVSIDGTPVSAGWVQVGASSYEVARVPVADGVHVLDGSAPFGVITMGWDSYDSYAYPGGLDQQIINPIN